MEEKDRELAYLDEEDGEEAKERRLEQRRARQKRRRQRRLWRIGAWAFALACVCILAAAFAKSRLGSQEGQSQGELDGAEHSDMHAQGDAQEGQEGGPADGGQAASTGGAGEAGGEEGGEDELSQAGNVTDVEADVVQDPDEILETRPVFEGDIASLDNTLQNWGQGVQFDELMRPAAAVAAQEKYGKYSADFVHTETEEKKIYLTFDEGYENGYTSQILDVLKEKDCPAVFFVTQPYVEQEGELVQRMIEEGHVVGNHSVNHPSAGVASLPREEQEQELLGLHDYVEEHFGYEMSLFRYPAGKFSEQSLAIVQNIGYTSVFWSFAHADWDPANQPEEGAALQKLLDRLHPGAIYLLHAVSATNTHILGQFIDQARAAGYEFCAYQ